MKKCEKCGAENISVKYQAEGTRTSWNRKIKGVEKFMRNDDYYYGDKVEKEHLIFKCETCEFRKADNVKG